MNFDIEKHTILKVLSGSHAYGLATSTSDFDYRGIAIPPVEYFHGYAFRFEQYEGEKGEDLAVYDIRKFFQLAADCNPNVVELLWVPERCVVVMTPWGERLVANRKLFLSTKARHTFSGYAIAQLKRIKTHRRWLLDAPQEKPTRAKYSLPEVSTVSASIRSVLKAAETAEVSIEDMLSPAILDLWKRERAFFEAQREWENYENWKKSRNQKRAELEAKFGYDTKHAMHLVRLMRMCREILTTGEIVVDRPDHEDLLAIRNGAWSYDQLMEWAERQDQELTAVYESCIILPKSPDIKKLDALCVELVEDFHGIITHKGGLR
jgi:hypothetical protein